MHFGQYQHWAAKPKNGGLDAETAKVDFDKLCNTPCAMTDNFGSEKFPKRVWVKTRDLVTFQDKYSKAKACELGRDTNKYKQEDVDTAMNQVQLAHEEAGRLRPLSAAWRWQCQWSSLEATVAGAASRAPTWPCAGSESSFP